jgi:hypothetical protein
MTMVFIRRRGFGQRNRAIWQPRGGTGMIDGRSELACCGHASTDGQWGLATRISQHGADAEKSGKP